jgi:hypothetical protein
MGNEEFGMRNWSEDSGRGVDVINLAAWGRNGETICVEAFQMKFDGFADERFRSESEEGARSLGLHLRMWEILIRLDIRVRQGIDFSESDSTR